MHFFRPVPKEYLHSAELRDIMQFGSSSAAVFFKMRVAGVLHVFQFDTRQARLLPCPPSFCPEMMSRPAPLPPADTHALHRFWFVVITRPLITANLLWSLKCTCYHSPTSTTFQT